MGSTTGDSDEQPVHQVTVSAFRLQKYEVTAAEYKDCVDAAVCAYNGPTAGTYYTYDRTGYADHPINYVNWYEAQDYCQWLGGDLPTEAQWEFAARGTTGRTYPWGNESPDATRLNYNDNANVTGTMPVGNYPMGVSPFGLYDMAGNVQEWVADWYVTYPSTAQVDPTGSDSGTHRAQLGGSFNDGNYNVRAADRDYYTPEYSNLNVGFRCASPQ